MGSRRYTVKMDSLNDGVYYTDTMSLDYRACDFRIVFYDKDGKPVSPTAGTVKPEVMSLPGQWMTSGDDVTTLDAKLCGGSATYTIPYFGSCGTMGRVTLSGITGAVKAMAVFTALD